MHMRTVFTVVLLGANFRYSTSSSSTPDEGDSSPLPEKISEDALPSEAEDVLSRVARQSERDPYIFNLFEVLLTTLETKLRRVENMDRALERLVRRLDTMEARLAVNFNTTTQMAQLLENRLLDPKTFRSNSGRSASGSTEEDLTNSLMEQRLFLLTEHVARIDKKLSNMQKALDSNSISLPQDELVASASENYRVGVPRVQALEKNSFQNDELTRLQESMDIVQDSVNSMDRRLQIHMAYVSGDLEKLADSVSEVRAAILEDQTLPVTTDKPPQEQPSWNTTIQVVPRRTKIDSLVDRMSPMETVWEKMEEVWDVVVGTKSSVDVLVPKSEELLNTSQRQERAISTIQYDLTEKANHIIQNLVQVEKTLKTMPRESKSSRDHINPVSLLHRSTQGHHVQDDTPADDPPGDLADQSFLLEHNSNDSFTTTERPAQRSPVGPSGLVFPSVQKKPDILNSTFMINNMHEQNLKQGYSCSDLSSQGMIESGTYYLKIRGTTYWFLKVYCDMDTAGGGWTVIQRRDDFGEPRETFNREWDDYKHGFGNPEAEFWLGNENIYMLTNTDDYMLRVELEDFDGNRRYIQYSTFKLHSEQDMYKLEIGGYSGNAGDSLNDPWYGSNLSPFSTVNRDNDRSSLNCASMLKGGWWWRSCGRGLNGLYLTDPNDLTARQGIVWFRWRGWDYTLKKSVLMIRPKKHTKERKST
ncbi:angiopoietin-2 isoform X2 [Macrobrachium rosenbergii]|uniref:angiopoietin-2 isoform X2 n=1 Tax=Macrobrachium rosenbergii TaxID=79674 RepID=UPI0034D78B41